MSKTKVAIIGSGNIGTDLMIKVLRLSSTSRWARWSASTPASDGLARASGSACRPPTKASTASSPCRLRRHRHRLRRHLGQGARGQRRASSRRYGKRLIDLTPAAIGPYVVPAVNLDEHLDAANVNMVTCGGQATIPIVAAVSRSTRCPTPRSSPRSPRSRPARAPAPTSTSSPRPPRGHRGGRRRGQRGKAIIVLNPAEPPLIMRDTVFCLVATPTADHDEIARASSKMVADVAAYVPGYRLKQQVQFRRSPRPAGPPPRRGAGRSRLRCRCSSRSRAPRTTCRPTPATSTS